MSTGGAIVMIGAFAILLFVWWLAGHEKKKMDAYKANKARLQAEAAATRP
jgi:hypothetical protein